MKKIFSIGLSLITVLSIAICSISCTILNLKSQEFCDHIYDGGVVTVEATCVDGGTLTKTCTLCGKVVNEGIPVSNEHNYSNSICTVCGKLVYLFNNTTAYSEVPISQSKFSAGNWYRFYNIAVSDLPYYGGINLQDIDSGPVWFFIDLLDNSSDEGKIYYGKNDIKVEYDPSFYVIGDGYTDIYFPLGLDLYFSEIVDSDSTRECHITLGENTVFVEVLNSNYGCREILVNKLVLN